MKIHTNGKSIRDRAVLAWGKMRRFYLGAFGNGYLAKQMRERKGECSRCGACCKLMYNCPFLDESGEITRCRIYGLPIPNCKMFPVDERDIRDRNLVMPDSTCGYYFDSTGKDKSGGNGKQIRG